jgi:hypothetical protein
VNRRHLRPAKQPHQLILQREEELRRSRVPLAGGAAAKLIVDAARLVSLGSNHVQTADIPHPLLFFDETQEEVHLGGIDPYRRAVDLGQPSGAFLDRQ